MKYTPKQSNVLVAVTYGSHLYGTSGPTSDHDFKAISLPRYRDLILGRGLKVDKYKYDAEGNTVPEDVSMPANGYEAEHTPLQKFVKDYLGGQAYAVELAYAVLQGAHEKHITNFAVADRFVALCSTLTSDFKHKNVQGMVGFAVKQTFDYVRRGERLNAAKALRTHIVEVLECYDATARQSVRLDNLWSFSGTSVLEELSKRTGLKIGKTVNADRVNRTLELNGRSYLETTAVSHLLTAVDKLIDQYGERSTKASETDIDWKSMSHAVRVYQQVIELLETGWIQFPRPNADALKAIKNGLVPLNVVKDLLRELDDKVQVLVDTTTRPAVDHAMHEAVDELVFQWIENHYTLVGNE